MSESKWDLPINCKIRLENEDSDPEIYGMNVVNRDGDTLVCIKPNGEKWYIHTSNYQKIKVID